MTARAQAAGIRPHRYAVVVNSPRRNSYTIGPYTKEAGADAAAKRIDGVNGFTAWVEPLYAEHDAQALQDLEDTVIVKASGARA